MLTEPRHFLGTDCGRDLKIPQSPPVSKSIFPTSVDMTMQKQHPSTNPRQADRRQSVKLYKEADGQTASGFL